MKRPVLSPYIRVPRMRVPRMRVPPMPTGPTEQEKLAMLVVQMQEFHAKQIADHEELLSTLKGKVEDKVAEVESTLSEAQRLIEETIVMQKGDPGEPGLSIKGDKGDAPPIEEIVQAVIPHIPKFIPTVRDGVDGQDAPPVDIKKVVKQVLKEIPKPKDGEDGKSPSPEEIIDLLKEKKLKIEHIDGLTEEISSYRNQLAGKHYGTDTMVRGGGDTVSAGSGVTISIVNGVKVISATGSSSISTYDISSQFDGIATTFTLPAYSSILQVTITGWPPEGVLRPTTDFTTPTNTTIALQSPLTAPVSGTTGIILYVPA